MNPKDKSRQVLGRGLGALLGDVSSSTATEKKEKVFNAVQQIPVQQIERNPFQPRTEFDEEALQELADSIREHGVIQPITVRQLETDKYQLIAGERRLRACQLIGLEQVPAYIRTANDEQMLEMALIENIQRQDLNPIEVALGFQRLIDECKLILEEVGKKVGKNRSTVNNYLRLLKLPPEIQAALRDNKLQMGHARSMISIPDPTHQLALLKKILEEGLSVRQVEELASKLKNQPENPAPVSKAGSSFTPFQLQIRGLENRLSQRYATRVQIAADDKGKGEIKMTFYSIEDMNRLLALLESGSPSDEVL